MSKGNLVVEQASDTSACLKYSCPRSCGERRYSEGRCSGARARKSGSLPQSRKQRIHGHRSRLRGTAANSNTSSLRCGSKRSELQYCKIRLELWPSFGFLQTAVILWASHI